MTDFEGLLEGRRADPPLRFRGIERHGLSDAVDIDVEHVHFEFPPSTILVERQDQTRQPRLGGDRRCGLGLLLPTCFKRLL